MLGLSYSQTVKWVGSYLSLNFGEDIPLSEQMAPGSLGNPQLSFKVTFKRLLDDPVNRKYQLNTALIYEGACTIIKNSSAIKQLSVLSSDDVVESLQKDYDMVYPEKYQDNKYGGRISGGSLLSVLSSALPIARMIRQGVQHVAPVAKTIADGAEKIGLGGSVVVKKGKRKAGAVINRNDIGEQLY